MAGHYVCSCNLNNYWRFSFGDLVLNHQIAKLYVSPLYFCIIDDDINSCSFYVYSITVVSKEINISYKDKWNL